MIKITSIKNTIMHLLRIADDFVFDNLGPIRILFVVRNNFGAECLVPIIYEFEKGRNIKIGLTHEIEGCCDWSASSDVQSLHKKYFSSEKACVYRKWHYVFTTDFSNLYFRRHTTLVLVEHGAVFGNGDYNEEAQEGNFYHKSLIQTGEHALYFTNSKKGTDMMKSYAAEIGSLSWKKFLISGFAKTDRAFGAHQGAGDAFLKAKNRFDPLKKVVVISSTWTKKSIFRTLGCDFVKDICTALGNGYTIFVTGHNRLWADDTSNLESKFRLLEREHDNFCFLPSEPNTFGLLNCGDIFIGDNSSIFLEYCLMDQPILFFDNPEFRFGEETTEDLYKSAASCFQGTEGLPDKIRMLLSKGDELGDERRQVIDYFLSNQGKAADYIANTIEKFGRISGPQAPSWKKLSETASIS